MRLKILIATILISALGYIFDYFDLYDPWLSEPLYILGLATFIPALLLVFLKKKGVFGAWAKLAAWWLPLSIVLIAVTPDSNNTWMPLYSVTKEMVTWLMAGLFSIISIVVITWTSLRNR
ncbi:MAG TPA: hypothetical protein VEB18_01430 [Candidatus Paceibacterota bacterium]|nr:hypothetical protein [Candidatus Paceibacterota bacterium]